MIDPPPKRDRSHIVATPIELDEERSLRSGVIGATHDRGPDAQPQPHRAPYPAYGSLVGLAPRFFRKLGGISLHGFRESVELKEAYVAIAVLVFVHKVFGAIDPAGELLLSQVCFLPC